MSDSNFDSSNKEKLSLAQWLIALLLITIISALFGWLLGGYIDNKHLSPAQGGGKPLTDEQKNTAIYLRQLPSIIKLPTLLVNLANPISKRIRLDVSLVVKKNEKLSPALSANITSDFLLFLRTATLDQLKGPTGIFYLRQDLLDRAKIRSNGKVSAILITSLILE